MGMPYSKQINAAFDQVTPLVAEGYKALETIKNIAVLLSWIQVLTVALLAAIAGLQLALLITLNPDLDAERRRLVTPTVRWFCARAADPLDFAARHPWLAAAAALAAAPGLVFAAACLADGFDPPLALRRRPRCRDGDAPDRKGAGGSSRRPSTQVSDECDGPGD